MTVKEIAEIAGLSSETVRSKGKEMYPDKFIAGRKTVFNENEAITIMAELRKKGFIQPTENLEEPTENLEVITRSDLATFGAAIVAETIKQIMPIIQQSKQNNLIEFKQDYFTTKGYCSKMGLQITTSEAITLGRLAAKTSREKGYEIHHADDEKYGQVGSYHIDIWKEVFSV